LFLLADTSPCIDAGDPDDIYNDVENPANPGFAKWPSKGLLRNDMGVYGGPGCLYFEPVTGIEEKFNFDLSGQQYQVFQNYPNPFTETTTISWQLPKETHVILKVYDFTGREIKTLVDCRMTKGDHKINFNASGLPAGVYFYQLKASGRIEIKRMIVIK
jgi:hypothetical protein